MKSDMFRLYPKMYQTVPHEETDLEHSQMLRLPYLRKTTKNIQTLCF